MLYQYFISVQYHKLSMGVDLPFRHNHRRVTIMSMCARASTHARYGLCLRCPERLIYTFACTMCNKLGIKPVQL